MSITSGATNTILSLTADDELKCASCLKEQNSADNIEDEIFYTNIDPDDPTKCNHRFCNRCKINNFNKKRNFACPLCQTIVKESNLKQQTYDDYEIKKDIKIRKKIKSIYNKTETDFPSLKEFQDYEEYVEDLIYNLVHNINKDEIEKSIKTYETSHMKEIAKKQIELDHINRLIEEQIIQEEDDKKIKILHYYENIKMTQLKEIEFKKNMNDYVISGEGNIDYTNLNSTLPPTSSTSPFISGVTGPVTQKSTTGQMSSAIHPLYILLGQRPEPKPIATATVTTNINNRISKTIIHTAGGFNPNIYLNRNLKEIMSCFDDKINISTCNRRKYSIKNPNKNQNNNKQMNLDE